MRVYYLIGMLGAGIGLAQTPSTRGETEFEVVSVKPQTHTAIDPFQPDSVLGALPSRRGGPGTGSPGRIRYSHVTLQSLIGEAYELYPDQVVGPSWLREDHYTVDAIVPLGATKDQFRQMFRNLLSKRFKLAFQWEERNFRIYSLIAAPGGPKLRPSAVTEVTEDDDPLADMQKMAMRVELDSRGCPVLPAARRAVRGNNACTNFVGYSMPELANWLERMVANETGTNFGSHASPAHITDATGLSGRFDFVLQYDSWYHVMANAPGMPAALAASRNTTSIFKAIEAQLGLKLDPATAKLKVMVIGDVERTPTEN